MIRYIPELIETGVSSLKIEGRVKSSFYVASIVKAYREAIDAYYGKEDYQYREEWFQEIAKVSNRDFTTGFYFHKPNEEDHNYGTSSYIRNYDFIGIVKGYDAAKGQVVVEQRNRFKIGDKIEMLPPQGPVREFVLTEMFDAGGNNLDIAPHPQMEVRIPSEPLPQDAILRKKSQH
jgi:putative protease